MREFNEHNATEAVLARLGECPDLAPLAPGGE